MEKVLIFLLFISYVSSQTYRIRNNTYRNRNNYTRIIRCPPGTLFMANRCLRKKPVIYLYPKESMDISV